MVLLAGPGPEGGGARCVSPPPPPLSRGAPAADEPADYEEYEDFPSLPDSRSIASDDSFYPPGGEEECGGVSAESIPEAVPEAASLLRAACANDVGLLRTLVRRGPRAEEVQETDRNGRTGLIVACYHGFVDTVVALAECPHVDVNWQDNEGNTALITAAQAGTSWPPACSLHLFMPGTVSALTLDIGSEDSQRLTVCSSAPSLTVLTHSHCVLFSDPSLPAPRTPSACLLRCARSPGEQISLSCFSSQRSPSIFSTFSLGDLGNPSYYSVCFCTLPVASSRAFELSSEFPPKLYFEKSGRVGKTIKGPLVSLSGS